MVSRRKQVVFVAGAGSAIRADCEEAGSARGSSAIRVNREEAGRYGERGHGSERGSEPRVDGRERIRKIARKRGSRGSDRKRGSEDREETRIARKRKGTHNQ